MVTDNRISQVVSHLKHIYALKFRGKEFGRFCVIRNQLKRMLGVLILEEEVVTRLQDEALKEALVVIDLDDLFPVIEAHILRGLRRPPKAVFDNLFPPEESKCSVYSRNT